MIFKVDRSREKVRQVEKGEFSAVDILLIIYTTVTKLKDKASIILWSSFILLMLWGLHGDMEILTRLFGEGWTKTITFDLEWGKELVSFIVGFLLVTQFMRSIIRNNDLGWRAVIVPVMLLTIWGASASANLLKARTRLNKINDHAL